MAGLGQMRKLLKQLSIKLTDYQHGKPADQMTQLSQFKPQNKNKLLQEPLDLFERNLSELM